MIVDLPAILLVLAAVIVALSLWAVHRDKDTTFDLTDLITYKGRVDNAKFCQMGAFFLSSWVIYHMELNGKLTEWAFGLYMAAWVGARVASMMAALRAKTIDLPAAPPIPPKPPEKVT